VSPCRVRAERLADDREREPPESEGERQGALRRARADPVSLALVVTISPVGFQREADVKAVSLNGTLETACLTPQGHLFAP